MRHSVGAPPLPYIDGCYRRLYRRRRLQSATVVATSAHVLLRACVASLRRSASVAPSAHAQAGPLRGFGDAPALRLLGVGALSCQPCLSLRALSTRAEVLLPPLPSGATARNCLLPLPSAALDRNNPLRTLLTPPPGTDSCISRSIWQRRRTNRMAHSLASGCGGRVRGHKIPLAKYFYIIIVYNNVVYGLQLVRLFVNFVPKSVV